MGRTSSSWVWFKLVAYGWWEGVREKQSSLSLPALLPARCLEPFVTSLSPSLPEFWKGLLPPTSTSASPSPAQSSDCWEAAPGNTPRCSAESCWRRGHCFGWRRGDTKPLLCPVPVELLLSNSGLFFSQMQQKLRKEMEARVLSHYFSTDGLKMVPYLFKDGSFSPCSPAGSVLRPCPVPCAQEQPGVCLGCPLPAESGIHGKSMENPWEQGQGRLCTWGSEHRDQHLGISGTALLMDHTSPGSCSWPGLRARRHFLLLEPLGLELWADRSRSSSELGRALPAARAGVAKTTSQCSQV